MVTKTTTDYIITDVELKISTLKPIHEWRAPGTTKSIKAPEQGALNPWAHSTNRLKIIFLV